LLAVSVDGVFYIPCYDHNGNIVRYVSEAESIAAQYTYDPYGNITDMSGALATQFSFGFSTKYHDLETGMIGYQQRFLLPIFGRWLNRDPIEEEGGNNLYVFCLNNPMDIFDPLGLLTSTEAFGHYRSGPDNPANRAKRTPMRISFDEINTSEVSVKDFPVVKRLLSEGKPGKYAVAWKSRKDNLPFATSGDQSLYLGNVSLKLEGTLEIKTDCTWKFDGTLKCFDDIYDFNASTHRSWLGEWLTSIGRKTSGKPFDIEIRGQKPISENGTYEMKKKGWRIY
jgi:RHS repeat-associated protein